MIPNYLFSQILGFNFSTWGKATNALAGDPPRQDYTILATLDHYTVAPVQAGGGVTQARADAANALMTASLDLTAKLNAAEISLDRASGASEADDINWSSQQTAAYLYYQTQAAQAMQVVADKLDAMVQEMQSEGIPDRVYTADQIRAYQDALRTGAYPWPGVYPAQGTIGTEAVQALHLTDSDIQDIIQQRLSVDPNDAAGSVYGLLQYMATTLRDTSAALLTPDSVFAVSSQIGGGAPQGLMPTSVATTTVNNLIRAYPQSFPVAVGNPTVETATVELRVRPIDLPANWAAVVSPITMTLGPGEQFTATLTVAPAAPAVQGTMPRVAVEGYISNTLIGGVAVDVVLPNYVYFDGQLRVYLPLAMK